MSLNAFQSLHTLLAVFGAVPTSISSSVDVKGYLERIDQARIGTLDGASALADELAPLAVVVGVPVVEFFVDCAAVIAISSALQCALSHRLGGSLGLKAPRNAGIGQEDTHLLVDLWGQVESSRALFEFVIRYSQQVVPPGAHSAIKTDSLRAQYRVLMGGLERLILEVGTRFGERHTIAEAALAMDWCLLRLRAAQYLPLKGAVELEMSGMSV